MQILPKTSTVGRIRDRVTGHQALATRQQYRHLPGQFEVHQQAEIAIELQDQDLGAAIGRLQRPTNQDSHVRQW